jgi:hypothetical protein
MTKIRYIIGKIILRLLMPLWIVLSLVWWRDNSAFIMRHVNMLLTGVDEY